ncbi:methyltransferase [Streptomyces alkaliphilus]|uniref:methyltransferase n=1 Tax=Streptomyces alkaliphilus TaxID=1472722 RepID=UPI00117F5539|nr:methyltransferase [Streptomyces alkaliphilus]MQS06118.1 methyltransferase [Streptomyces alkaliphilus]
MPGSETTAARRVVDLITGTWRARALYAAVSLSLPDHIAAGHGTVPALSERTGAGEDGLVRLLRLLVALGVITGDEEEGYGLTEVGALLVADGERSMRDMVLLYGEEFHRAWGAVVPAVRTGTSGFEHAFGMSLHTYLRDDPEAGPRFLRAMNAGNVFFPEAALAFDFTGAHTVIDVAGGSGLLLSAVLQAHPHLSGTVFDLPHMLPVAERHLSAVVDVHRYETVAGDVFDKVPAGNDVYLLSRVLQDWDDERCVTLLANIREAMADGGRLLVLERVVVTDDTAPLLPLLWDLHLLMAAGGRERTLDGYRSLLHAAGLRLESVHSLALETSLLVAAPM